MTERDWHGCYDGGWGDLIVEAAYSHPAKFARGLIERIVQHGFDQGWWKAGDIIADPFAGIGTGGIIAAYRGLFWWGIELEARFCELAMRNFNLHANKWAKAKDYQPHIIQGDSREFATLVGACDSIVTSPPFVDTGLGSQCKVARNRQVVRNRDASIRPGENAADISYGQTPGQIGRLKAGKVDAILTSPPYADTVKGEHGETETATESRDKRRTEGGSLGQSQRHGGYGVTDGNLGQLKPGDVDAVVTSPPWADREGANSARKAADPEAVARKRAEGYASGKLKGHAASKEAILRSMKKADLQEYGSSNGQIGNEEGGTYWQAVAAVYEQCRLVLKPGGMLVVVVKDYVKNKKRVPLCDDTLKLLVKLGFEPVERIRAHLVKEDRHPSLFGGDHVATTQRKSFFRLLAERKGSPRIDFEEVLCVRRGKEFTAEIAEGAGHGQTSLPVAPGAMRHP